MKLAVLYSGGKDSNMTVWKAVQECHDVKYLISLISESPESYMFHYPNVNLTKVQADCLGIHLITAHTKGEKEKELVDLENVIASVADEIDGVGAGALASQYQYERVGKICKKLGLKVFAPFWQIDPDKYWDDILSNGFEVVITGVAAEGLSEKWLGRVVDEKALGELKKIRDKTHIHLGLEGGEGETFVLDGPNFRKKIIIKESEKIMEDDCTGRLVIKDVEVVGK